MPESNRIFRQAALDRLSSPEQLDQLMQVTTSKSWLALAACAGLVLIALAWGIWGSIGITVSGRGILIKHGGVFVATAFGDGRVAEILVHPGDTVTNDQALVRLSVQDLELKIRQARMAQTNLESELLHFKSYLAQERSQETTNQEAEVQTYQLISNDYQTQVDALHERLDRMKALYLRQDDLTNAIDLPTLLTVTNDLLTAKHGLELTKVQMKQVEFNHLQAEERRNELLLDKAAQVTQGQRNIDYLTAVHRETSIIRSPFEGTVLEVTVKSNQLVNVNSPIMSLQSSQEKLEGWLFLTPGDGKRVSGGMSVYLSPASARRERYGMMKGQVATVSQIPATPQLMLSILENPTLVSEFSQEGAPIYATVELKIDTNTLSGFQWTSRSGTNMQVTSGTPFEGTITITNTSPLSIVLPWFKEGAGL